MRPVDTSEAAWKYLEDALRRMTPAERFQRSVSLTIAAHAMTLAGIRAQYPHEDERRWRLRLAARMIDKATMRSAFDWTDD